MSEPSLGEEDYINSNNWYQFLINPFEHRSKSELSEFSI
jgi:hypothetical protein